MTLLAKGIDGSYRSSPDSPTALWKGADMRQVK